MLEGDLGDFSLPDILRLLASTSKTGRLRLDAGDRHGRVDLIDGHIRDASADAARLSVARRLLGLGLIDGATVSGLLEGRDQLPTDLELARTVIRDAAADDGRVAEVLQEQAIDAVFDLLRWDDGSFRFDAGGDRDVAAPSLTLVIDEVLGAAEQRLQRWPGIEQRTGPGDAVPTISRPPGEGSFPDVEPDGWALLAFVDGRRTVDQLVELTGRGQFEARRTLGTLVDQGVVRIGEANARGPVEHLLEAHRMLSEREAALPSSLSGAGRSPDAPPPSVAWTDGPPAAPPSPEPMPYVAAPVAPATRDALLRDAMVRPPLASRQPDRPDRGVTPLPDRTGSRRLTADPDIDNDLVTRLIDGVEGL